MAKQRNSKKKSTVKDAKEILQIKGIPISKLSKKQLILVRNQFKQREVYHVIAIVIGILVSITIFLAIFGIPIAIYGLIKLRKVSKVLKEIDEQLWKR